MSRDEPNCIRRFRAAWALLRNRRADNETFCFAEAFDECSIALKGVPDDRVSDVGVDHALEVIRETIDCSDVAMWDQRGRSFARAEQLSRVERNAFEDAVRKVLLFLDSGAGMAFLRAAEQVRHHRGAA